MSAVSALSAARTPFAILAVGASSAALVAARFSAPFSAKVSASSEVCSAGHSFVSRDPARLPLSLAAGALAGFSGGIFTGRTCSNVFHYLLCQQVVTRTIQVDWVITPKVAEPLYRLLRFAVVAALHQQLMRTQNCVRADPLEVRNVAQPVRYIPHHLAPTRFMSEVGEVTGVGAAWLHRVPDKWRQNNFPATAPRPQQRCSNVEQVLGSISVRTFKCTGSGSSLS
jgi:hypothetical protein